MLDHNPLAASVKGERYEASVPDTLDLADRMGLAVNAMTNVWFPSERFALAFNVEFSRRPPVLSINHLTDAYLNIPAKFIEALVVCRLASGSRQNIEVDRGVLDAQLSFIGGDGLTYCPTDTLIGAHRAAPVLRGVGGGPAAAGPVDARPGRRRPPVG